METRNPVESYFGREFPAICNRCGVMADWSRKTLKMLNNFCVILKKRLLTVKFSIFCSESFSSQHRSTCCVQLLWNLADGKSVKSCATYLTKKNKISPGSSAVATERIAPNICQGQPPTMYSEFSRFHYNRFTFGQVIAECVNTTKPRRKVNPIFDWSPASRLIKTVEHMTRQCQGNAVKATPRVESSLRWEGLT